MSFGDVVRRFVALIYIICIVLFFLKKLLFGRTDRLLKPLPTPTTVQAFKIQNYFECSFLRYNCTSTDLPAIPFDSLKTKTIPMANYSSETCSRAFTGSTLPLLLSVHLFNHSESCQQNPFMRNSSAWSKAKFAKIYALSGRRNVMKPKGTNSSSRW